MALLQAEQDLLFVEMVERTETFRERQLHGKVSVSFFVKNS